MKCGECTYRYDDGFCMKNCYYVDEDDEHCETGTTLPIEFDYKVIYRLCNDYIDICNMFTEKEKLRKKYPNEFMLNNFDLMNFMLNCTLNDLHREMSLWKTKR